MWEFNAKLEVETVAILLRTQRSQFQISAQRLAILTEALSRFPESLEKNFGRVSISVTTVSFHIPYNLLLINQPIIRSYLIWVVDSIVK
jgi:hypothetical protein